MDKPLLLIITSSPIKAAFFSKEYATTHIESEDEAIDTLKHSAVSLIVIDEKTHSLSIFSCLKNIRKMKELRNVPIFVITGNLKIAYTRKLLAAGATDFLREPLNYDELKQRVEVAKRHFAATLKTSSVSDVFQSMEKNNGESLEAHTIKAISDAQESHEDLTLLLVETKDPKAAEKLSELMRPQDFYSPLEKGKYLITLPKTSEPAALLIAESIQDVILETSIGLVNLSEGKETLYQPADQLFQLAQRCLNQAKAKGKIISHTKEIS